MRGIIHLLCSACKRKNYQTTKNSRTHSEKLEVKKFCRACRAHTPHKEGK
jgi:large subunit ribosomal protein L33